MTFAQEPLAYLLAEYPTSSHLDRCIAYLNSWPLSGHIKRRYFSQWAHGVDYAPTPADFERASRTVLAPMGKGGA